jgi:hypothetical protein
MLEYKLYRLDGGGRIERAPEQYAAESDEAALAEAQRRRAGGRAELWQGRRLVQRLGS